MIVPPARVYEDGRDEVTESDCLDWLKGFERELNQSLEEPLTTKPFRMIAALEGSTKRGWFYTIVIDMQAARFDEKLRSILDTFMPYKWNAIVQVAEGGGFVEACHLLGRLGLSRFA